MKTELSEEGKYAQLRWKFAYAEALGGKHKNVSAKGCVIGKKSFDHGGLSVPSVWSGSRQLTYPCKNP